MLLFIHIVRCGDLTLHLVRSGDSDGSAVLNHLLDDDLVRGRHPALVSLGDGDWDPLLDRDLVGNRHSHFALLSSGDGHCD